MARRALPDHAARDLRRVVGAYLAYQTFSSANFFWPVFVVFYQRHGRLDLPAIFALQAFHTLARVLLELPLGLVADRFGRRPALVASAALTASGCGVMIVAPDLAAFYVAEFCFAAALAARSGADSALLFDALARHGQAEDYPRVEGRAQSLAAGAAAVSAIASGWLLEWWLPLPYVCTLAASAATLVVALALDDGGRGGGGATVRAIATGALAEIAASPAARWLITLFALLTVLSHTVFYLQQPYFEAIGVPVSLFGVVFAAKKVVHGLVAARAARIETLVSPARMPAFLLAAALLPIGFMGIVPFAAGALLVPLRGVADGLLQPVVNFYLNQLVSPLRRASVLSLSNLVARLAQAGALAAFGVALAGLSAMGTLRVAFVAGALLGILLLALRRRAARPGGTGRPTLAASARVELGPGD